MAWSLWLQHCCGGGKKKKMLNLFRFMQVFWLVLFVAVVVLCISAVLGIWTTMTEHIREVDSYRNSLEEAHLRVRVGNSLPSSVQLSQAALKSPEKGTEKLLSASASSNDPEPPIGHKKIFSEEILSVHAPVTSDVMGNLGAPSVVTSEAVEDWLRDRWQSARNMQGEPIPGEHWLEIDLGRRSMITKILLDWEQAFCTDYTVFGHNGAKVKGPGETQDAVFLDLKELASGREARTSQPSKQHVLHELLLPPPPPSHSRKTKGSYRFIRLVMHRPATQWAPSLWRFQVYGWRR